MRSEIEKNKPTNYTLDDQITLIRAKLI
jgi:hypothetical protein